jgi:hypothetical protein
MYPRLWTTLTQIEAILIRPTKPVSSEAAAARIAQLLQVARRQPTQNILPNNLASNDEDERHAAAAPSIEAA